MLTCNAEEVQDSLLNYRDELERKLFKMVVAFAGELAGEASASTKQGDAATLAIGQADIEAGADSGAAAYASMYNTRADTYGIEARIGFHAGAWIYQENPNSNTLTTTKINELPDVIQETREAAASAYTLGETFYIAATGPAFGKAIVMEDIQVAYNFDFKRLFDKG